MDDAPVALKVFELVLIFGGVLAFCFWELYKLRRERKRDKEREEKK
ncbi:MAG: hypothetical protein LW847_14925 [Burkholderiales bacterium]|jgi:hypothetical protein|nr:hypothetical protein [Burkholderiales bacterium]